MKAIKLKKYGKFLTGRSLATEVIEQYHDSLILPLAIDFQGVESFTQSFISELLYQLRAAGIDVTQLTWKGLPDQRATTRIKDEVERISSLLAS